MMFEGGRSRLGYYPLACQGQAMASKCSRSPRACEILTTVARLGLPLLDSALQSPSRLTPSCRAIWLKFRERAIDPSAWAMTVGSSSAASMTASR